LRRRIPNGTPNWDEQRYPARLASYSKGLPHDDQGLVEPVAYDAFLHAIRTGDPLDFKTMPVGGGLKQANPQAAYTVALQGPDSHRADLPEPPELASDEAFADIAEVYWQAVTRDVPFADYSSHPLVLRACRDLSRFAGFRGPRQSSVVSPSVAFRGMTKGDLKGPYVSQFLFAPIPHGVFTLEQRFRNPVPTVDFMQEEHEWLAIQRGAAPSRARMIQADRHYVRTGRDLAGYVHRDYSFQAFLNAALLLISLGDDYLAPNPYTFRSCAVERGRTLLTTESGYCTFGGPHHLEAIAAVTSLALRAAWYQKWILHRRLRPEVAAHRVSRAAKRSIWFDVGEDLRRSELWEVLPASGLLPMAYPEGAPAHPSYPAGHAAVAGACATILKAFFREDAPFPGAVVPSADGLSLVPIEETLTVGNELNKLASNIAIARDFAGVHYRSDAVGGLTMGESIAIDYLREMRLCLTEDFDGFALTSFDDKPIVI